MAESDRNRAIELAMGQIEKQFGKGSIMRLGEGTVLPDIKSISTGSLSLNIALGIGRNVVSGSFQWTSNPEVSIVWSKPSDLVSRAIKSLPPASTLSRKRA